MAFPCRSSRSWGWVTPWPWGVPAEFIALDRLGLNTAATVRNTIPGLHAQRVLVVSEFYHLPRLKLSYAQAGLEVYTVPAKPAHWLRAWPINSIVREVPAFWSYWLRGLMPSLHGIGNHSDTAA